MWKTAYIRADKRLPGKMYVENSIHSSGSGPTVRMYVENSIHSGGRWTSGKMYVENRIH